MRFVLPLLFACIAVPAHAAAPVTGSYVTEDKKAVVTIGTCGKTVCGKISKILAPTPKGPPVDERNPDPKLHDRPILGLPILTGFRDDGDVWEGRIYSPEEGKTYKSKLQKLSDGRLKVQGCVLFICKTQYWRPVR